MIITRALSIALLPLATSLVAACIPGLDLFGEAPECEGNRDCDDDEDCDDGECVAEDDDDDDGGEGEGEGEGDVPPDPEGPRYLQFNTNVTVLEGGSSSVIFTAVLTDPDGIDDIIGGSLIDPTTDASYGAFATSAAEGSYELTLSWSAINTVGAIDFADSVARSFRARFFDVAGHVAEQSLTLTLTCGDGPACDGDCGGARCGDGACTFADGAVGGTDATGNAICGGQCVSMIEPERCGQCNFSCVSDQCLGLNDPNGEGVVAVCGCGNGLDCGGGQACFGILVGSSDAICQAGGTPDDIGTSFPSTPQVSLDGFGLVPLCNGLTQAEANLYCVAAGHASAQIEVGTTVDTSEDIGFTVDCAGVSTFADCRFDVDETCLGATMTCQ